MILNVDDHEISRYVRTKALEGAGFAVAEAKSGNEALQRFRNEKPDLVLLDVNLPDQSGFEVCRTMKREGTDSLVLHISAVRTGPEHQVTGLDGGADAYLCEPVPPEVLVATVRAMLRKKRMRDEERSLHLLDILDSLPMGIVVASAGGRALLVNREMKRIWPMGIEASEQWPLIQEIVNGRRILGEEMEWTQQSGVKGVHLVNASAVEEISGERLAGVAAVLDVTNRKQVERALRQSNEELQHFAYAASHDLQEPLRTITAFTQLLSQRYKSSLDGDAEEIIKYTVNAAGRMTRLVHSLLDYSRVGAGKHSLERVGLDEVMTQVVMSLHESIRESEAEVCWGGLPVVWGIGSQISQLLQNLISNAVKYRKRGERVRIEVGAERRDGEWIILVRDNGQGFDPVFREQIFGAFQRLHGQNIAGTGMGLAICKRIVEHHGGRIWAETEPGQGSTFHFTIPEKAEQAEYASG